MKQSQEFEGKDVETAVNNACTTLGVSKNDLKYEVISSGATGIFGIVGRKDARIKVRIAQSQPKGSPEGSTMDETEMDRVHSIVDEAFGQDTRPSREKTSAEPVKEARGPSSETADVTEKPAAAQKQASDEKETVPEAADVTAESVDLGIKALQKMADLITEDATVTADTDKDKLILKINGGNAGILIGRKGQTLDAMQFLTDKIINRKSSDRVRVKVDIEGYMETRKSNLESLAQKMAEKARKTGRPATINQMSAQDRRIVHLALKDDARVRTQSMGDGYYRRLVIFPKKNNTFRGKRPLKK